ncbi:MAG: chemotaxis protein CheW [Candidatus Thiodiazotropha sp.]
MIRRSGETRSAQPASKIAEPDTALKSYLDTLLSEIDGLSVAAPPTEVKEALANADIKCDEVVDARVEVTTQATISEAESGPQPVVPQWADEAFQVLLFEVNGIKLGIPLASLMGILNFSGAASQLPGQPSWSLGVIVNREEKVVVIDSARLLMPERLGIDEAVSPQQLLLIGDGDRALAVDRICNTLVVDKEAIRWRYGAGIRPWYAGIIIEELSVLLDVDGIMKMLAG